MKFDSVYEHRTCSEQRKTLLLSSLICSLSKVSFFFINLSFLISINYNFFLFGLIYMLSQTVNTRQIKITVSEKRDSKGLNYYIYGSNILVHELSIYK